MKNIVKNEIDIIEFVEKVCKIQLLDYQKYILLELYKGKVYMPLMSKRRDLNINYLLNFVKNIMKKENSNEE